MAHRVSDSTSSMVIWYGYFSHLTLPRRQCLSWVGPLLFGCNISLSILGCFLKSVLLINASPASSEHTSRLQGFELLILSSILSVDESYSWQKIGSFCACWLLSDYTRVQLIAAVDTSHSDRN